ncbi:hypothetical protein RUM44_009552 [Polyplax serrata]|uniref:Peptidase S1 domain-containing protein n=1 Tax=Polyplax serrata TaxID=468196 RepID=A0ABR1ASZ9_POLSC
MKVTLLFWLVLLSSVLGGDELGKLSSESLSISSRIYGGNEAEEGQFPYMVMVFTRMTNGELRRCSGSRVAKDWVLTAANCILDGMTEKDIILVAGRANLELYILARKYIPFDSVIRDNSFDTEERRVKSFVRHPKYSQGQIHDNIALIELKTPFTDKVPLLKISPDKKDRHGNCTILGWGDTEAARDNGKLMYAKAISAVTPSFGCAHKDSGNFYCLDDVKKGICLRDFGGPLVCDGMAWGVASHFLPETVLISCGRNYEQYYTEIHPYKSWLDLYLPNASSPLNLSGTFLYLTFNNHQGVLYQIRRSSVVIALHFIYPTCGVDHKVAGLSVVK